MLSLLGLGSALPDTVLDNAFLHRQVGLSQGPDWVASRLGIERRYSVLPPEYLVATRNQDPTEAMRVARARGLTPVTLGVEAARRALERAGLRPAEVGWVMAATDTPFETLPSTASRIAEALGVPGGPHCDVNAGCCAFALHMKLLAETDPRHLPDHVLCVQTSTYTVRTDYRPDCSDGYIWGDGAAAQVASCSRPGRLVVEPLIFGSDASAAGAITIDAAGHFRQDGARVREFSIRRSCEMLEQMAETKGLFAESTYTILHQANHRMQESVIGHLELPAGRHLHNVREQGNIAAAGCPSVLDQAGDRLRPGDEVLYAVVGAGLAWGGGYLRVEGA